MSLTRLPQSHACKRSLDAVCTLGTRALTFVVQSEDAGEPDRRWPWVVHMRRWLMTSVLQATLHMVDLEVWDKQTWSAASGSALGGPPPLEDCPPRDDLEMNLGRQSCLLALQHSVRRTRLTP